MKKSINVAVLIALVLGLSGCSVISGTGGISDKDMIEKAAFSLGVQPSDITLLEKDAGAMDLQYKVQVKGKKDPVPCYIDSTIFGLIQSDAVCGGGKSNALLDAAGKK
jgi:hypothetical protein